MPSLKEVYESKRRYEEDVIRGHGNLELPDLKPTSVGQIQRGGKKIHIQYGKK